MSTLRNCAPVSRNGIGIPHYIVIRRPASKFSLHGGNTSRSTSALERPLRNIGTERIESSCPKVATPTARYLFFTQPSGPSHETPCCFYAPRHLGHSYVGGSVWSDPILFASLVSLTSQVQQSSKLHIHPRSICMEHIDTSSHQFSTPLLKSYLGRATQTDHNVYRARARPTFGPETDHQRRRPQGRVHIQDFQRLGVRGPWSGRSLPAEKVLLAEEPKTR